MLPRGDRDNNRQPVRSGASPPGLETGRQSSISGRIAITANPDHPRKGGRRRVMAVFRKSLIPGILRLLGARI